MEPRYNWERYWVFRSASLNFNNEGFLREPSERYWDSKENDIKLFSQINSYPCLCLLGEPGIGKSDSLLSEFNKSHSSSDMIAFLHNCRAFGSETRFISEIFRSNEVNEAIKDNKKIILFLDALDEGILQLKAICEIILSEIKKFPNGTIFLRITCRTAQWPQYFEKELNSFYGEENIGIFELAPLTKNDISLALIHENINPDDFLRELIEKDIVLFSTKPLTLKFLIKIYSQSSKFPSTRAEIYSQGIKILCQETNDFRRSIAYKKLDTSQKISIAERIAAMTIFCNISAFTLSPKHFDNNSVLLIEDACGGKESFEGTETSVLESDIISTFSSGLFVSKGEDLLGWGHQSYSEYLASKYVSKYKINKNQFYSLFTTSEHDERKIIPQLSQTVIELISHDLSYFDLVLELEPELFLGADLSLYNDAQKDKILERIFEHLKNGKLQVESFSNSKNLNKFSSVNISKVLEPIILDKSLKTEFRQLALVFISKCKCYSLLDDIVDILNNPQENYWLRVDVANIIEEIGKEKHKKLFLKYIETTEEFDPNDEIKACALNITWPHLLNSDSLFSVLTEPKSKDYVGAYKLFLRTIALDNLNINDLEIALKWALKLPLENEQQVDSFGHILDSIIIKAWEHIKEPKILNGLVSLVLQKLKHNKPLLSTKSYQEINQLLLSSSSRRLLFFLNIVQQLPNKKDNWFLLIYPTQYLFEEDLLLLLDEIYSLKDQELKYIYCMIHHRLNTFRNGLINSEIINRSNGDPILYEVYKDELIAIDLDSPEASEAKEKYDQYYGWQNKKNEAKPIIPPSKDVYIDFLCKIENGDLDAWWHLNYYLSIYYDIENNHSLLNEDNYDITQLPNWIYLNDPQYTERLAEIALSYINNQSPTMGWLGSGKRNRSDDAGVRALYYLHSNNRKLFELIENDVLASWFDVILTFPLWNVQVNEVNGYSQFIHSIFNKAPHEFLKSLNKIIQNDYINKKYHSRVIPKLSLLSGLDDIILVLGKWIVMSEVPEDLAFDLIRYFASSNNEVAFIFLTQILLNEDKIYSLEKTTLVSERLLLDSKNSNWSLVKPYLLSNTEMLKDLLLKISYRREYHKANFFEKMNEAELEELYDIIEINFPTSLAPVHLGNYTIKPIDSIEIFKSDLINYLTGMGMVSGLENIKNKFPELSRMDRILHFAKQNYRIKSWKPMSPTNFLKLIANNQLRYVQSNLDLMALVIESLHKINALLQGATPASIFLWNKVDIKKKFYRPKDEDDISDFIKILLEKELGERGIIINREVEIKRNVGGKRGQVPDIVVNAIPKISENKHDRLSLFIEVKGCWNSKVKEAMETQLVSRYLRNSDCSTGIYLIAWCLCPQWDEIDKRKKNTPFETITEAWDYFNKQSEQFIHQGLLVNSYCLDISLH